MRFTGSCAEKENKKRLPCRTTLIFFDLMNDVDQPSATGSTET